MISGISYGQIKFSISTEQEYSDNPFLSPFPVASYMSSYDFGIEGNLKLFEVGYYGSYSMFDAIPERNYYWHQFGAWHRFESGQLGAYVERRMNQPESAYFDYTNLTAYYRTRFNIKNLYFTIAPNVNYTTYDNISILDNIKGNFNFNINYGSDIGLTLIAGGGINYKHYQNPSSVQSITYLDEDGSTFDTTLTIKNLSSLTQLVGFARVAKSITPTTGLAVQFTNRSLTNSIKEEVKDVNIIFGDESEMFDDPVNYEGNVYSIELTQILFGNMVVKGGYYYLNKNYPTQGIYDELYVYDTSFMRTDVQKVLSISVRKKFDLPFMNDSKLAIGLYYRQVVNESNSFWFNYKANSFNVSLDLEF